MKNRRTTRRVTLLQLLLFTGGCGKKSAPPPHELRITEDVDIQALSHRPSKNLDAAIARVDQVLAVVHATELPENLPNWIAYHASLMFGPTMHQEFLASPNANRNIKRIYSILLNSDTDKEGPFVIRGGQPYPRKSGARFMTEHHPDQFLTYFSMGGGQLDVEITVDHKNFTLHDVFEQSLSEARSTNELAYTILAYSHYLQPGKRWQNKFGEELSLAALLEELLTREELTCGGAHRMGALARTMARHELRDDPQMARLWPEMERQINAALVSLNRSQREDGGFPIIAPGFGSQSPDHLDVYCIGHCVEWITLLGDGGYPSDDWVVKAVLRLADAVEATCWETYRNIDMVRDDASYFDFDGLSHALSGLSRWRNVLQKG